MSTHRSHNPVHEFFFPPANIWSTCVCLWQTGIPVLIAALLAAVELWCEAFCWTIASSCFVVNVGYVCSVGGSRGATNFRKVQSTFRKCCGYYRFFVASPLMLFLWMNCVYKVHLSDLKTAFLGSFFVCIFAVQKLVGAVQIGRVSILIFKLNDNITIRTVTVVKYGYTVFL